MALTKAKKAQILDGLKKVVADSKSIAFVHVKGMSVFDTNVLRTNLRNNDAKYQVVKKTLLKKTLSDAGIAGDLPELPGELAIAYSPDLLSPAREVYAYRKGKEDKLVLVGGVFEGKFMNAAEMASIALIPGMQTLRGMFANIINSPIQRFVIALDQIAQKKS